MGNFNNLSKVNQDRIQRIIDQSDGQDLDLMKVQKQFAKNKWDFPSGPPGYDYSQKGKNEPQ